MADVIIDTSTLSIPGFKKIIREKFGESADAGSPRLTITSFGFKYGVPTEADLDRLEQNVPRQEAGRISDSELSLSRANRSVRLWQHVIEALSAGQQPDRDQLEAVGYLVRTTAVYGSGKFGAADRLTIAGRPEVSGPFQAELLSVWLTRAFSIDLVEHGGPQNWRSTMVSKGSSAIFG